jgi:hypothetical protein
MLILSCVLTIALMIVVSAIVKPSLKGYLLVDMISTLYLIPMLLVVAAVCFPIILIRELTDKIVEKKIKSIINK